MTQAAISAIAASTTMMLLHHVSTRSTVATKDWSVVDADRLF
jgi:hypothetical protein